MGIYTMPLPWLLSHPKKTFYEQHDIFTASIYLRSRQGKANEYPTGNSVCLSKGGMILFCLWLWIKLGWLHTR